MSEIDPESRRRCLSILGGALVSTLAACGGARAASGGPARTRHEEHHEPSGELSATEDLMREHGVLHRLLLVYEESARRLRDAAGTLDPALIARAARLVRTFAEDYHERAEERWVFPPLARSSAHASTIEILRVQHARGRALTDEVLRRAGQGPAPGSESAARLASLLESFVRMYRPHAAREDTVIFPALRATRSERDFHELGERMEESEHAILGEGGFERAVSEVAQIERGLDIHDLARFTAPLLTSTP